MPTDKTINKRQIAIVGMDACFGSQDLDAFERSIYEGKNAECFTRLSSTEIIEKFDRVATIALKDAAINSDVNISTIIVRDIEQLDSTVTEANSVFDALLMARELLSKRQVEAVLVGGVDFKSETQAVGTVVLKRYETAKRNGDRIYAVVDAISLSPVDSQANDAGGIKPEDIAYLEILSNKPLEEVEIDFVNTVNRNSNSAGNCAVSSVINAGYSGIAAEIASLIKTALCLYYRYIPPVPQWQQPIQEWQHSFYVATEAKPWFVDGVSRRTAVIKSIDNNNAQIVLSEETAVQQRSNAYLEQTPCYLFPLVAEDSNTLFKQLETLKQTLASGNLAETAKQTFTDYQTHSAANYTLAIVGKNKPELLREIDRAFKGITKAFDTGKDWQTPVGSYFTSMPQGKKGKVAYVYPSAYNAHLGLCKDLFRLFPNLLDDPVIQSTCNRVANLERLLYPRSQKKLSARELEAKERQLMDDPLAMLELETGFAGLITTILRDYFQVKPQAAFGYSLGETSMMYAQGVWSDLNQSSDLLSTSPLFKTRLAGSKDAVKEYWQLSDEESQGELWRTYVLMANSDLVREKLQQERVYLTQISTPKEAVIAGDPQGCERVIASLGCDAFRAPFNHVIHCEAMQSEYDKLIELNTLPLRTIPQIDFYSAANYQAIELTSETIAHSVTQTLCQPLDFPRLVNQVYQDDFRIFIEVGVGSNCSRWIKDILKSKEHATISIHRRGTNDFSSLIKALAKLVSHRVPLDLSPLYDFQIQSKNKQVNKTPIKNNEPVDLWQEQTANSALHHYGMVKAEGETRRQGSTLEGISAGVPIGHQISFKTPSDKNTVMRSESFRASHNEEEKVPQSKTSSRSHNLEKTSETQKVEQYSNYKKEQTIANNKSIENELNLNISAANTSRLNAENKLILWQNFSDSLEKKHRHNNFTLSKTHFALLEQEHKSLTEAQIMFQIKIEFLKQKIDRST